MRFDPKDIVEHLRHNLERYPYDDGFPVLRELLQNADDARAEAVTVDLREGWPEAENPLLRGAGLLIVNNGDFDERSAQGMQTFGGSVKALDEAAVGRFGLGQKSVFHLCDAFVVVSEGYGAQMPFVVNPFETLGRPGDACLLWNIVADADAARLRAAGATSLPGKWRLNLWFPLRRPELRPKPKSNGIVAADIALASLAPLAERQKLAELLAALRHVRRVSVVIGAAKADLDRGHAPGMVGYTLEPGDRRFGGPLGAGLASLGRERRAADDFRRDLRSSAHWPRTRDRDTDEEELQKAAPHGAVIVVNDVEATAELSGDWAVLLPVAKAFDPIGMGGMGRLRLILHGYFFVDSGRKAVIGLDEAGTRPGDGAPGDEAGIRAAWNRSVRDRLVLPLIPGVLHDALTEQMLSGEALAAAVTALAGSDFGREHRPAICAEHALARVAETAAGAVVARWCLLPAVARLRPLPAPDDRGRIGFAANLPRLSNWAEARGLTLVCGPEAVLAPESPTWEGDELEELLGELDAAVFQAEATRARALVEFLAVACTGPALRAAAADPVLSCLRKALASERTLAPHEAIREVLGKVDCAGVVPLPPVASERPVLRVLAQAPEAVICLPRDWLPQGSSAEIALDLHKARPILAALQPLLQSDRHSYAAVVAALTIVKQLEHIDHALADPELSSLKVLRASSGVVPTLLSLGELHIAARGRRLFKDTPAARRRLSLLAAALPQVQAFILPDVVLKSLEDPGAGRSAPFQAVDLDPAAACALVDEATAFGPPAARAGLLVEIFTTDAESRGALRALAAGERRARREDVRLVALRETAPALDHYLARLLAQSAQEIPVPGVIVDRLDRAKQRHLAVAELAGQELGELILGHADALSDLGLDREVAAAILCAGIPEEALRSLPVLPRVSGGWASAEALFRRTRDWPVPPALRTLVPMLGDLDNAQAQQKAEALVQPWSPGPQIKLCLDQQEPGRFAVEILAALERAENPDTARLRSSQWLPDNRTNAWKPEDVLDLSDELLAAARQTLGDDLPFLPVGEVAAELRAHKGFAQLRVCKILPDAEDSLEALLLIVKEQCPVAYMGNPTAELAEALAELANAGADLPLPGWPLLAAVLRERANARPTDTGGLLKALEHFGGIPDGARADAVCWLNGLAKRVQERSRADAAGTDPARRAYDAGFEAFAKWDTADFRAVAGDLMVPTIAGSWRRGCEVTARPVGVAADHVLYATLEPAIRNHLDGYVDVEEGEHGPAPRTLFDDKPKLTESDCIQSMRALLHRLLAQVPGPALAFIATLALDPSDAERMAREVLALPQAQIDALTERLDEIVRSCIPQAEVNAKWVSLRKNDRLHFTFKAEGPVRIRTLDGVFRDAPSAIERPFQILGEGHLKKKQLSSADGRLNREIWARDIVLADSEGEIKRGTLEELVCTIGPFALWHFVRLAEAVCEELRQRLAMEQATVEDARARLEDFLPLLLAELKPKHVSALRLALDRYERKEQSIPPDQRAGKLAAAKRELWNESISESVAAELLPLIRQSIGRYGYGPARVIFELFQNADDAALQHPPETEPSCRVAFKGSRVEFVHWGRLINYLGPDPAAGEKKGWHRDLFNMLLMNLSEKREEVTGRFGLGFKSVHLIAREVWIASGFVACRVKGGMLPEVWERGRERSHAQARGGRRATVCELEIDPKQEEEARMAQEAFARSVRWLPAMARAIREIELDGRRHAARFAAAGVPGIWHVVLDGVEPGHALTFDLDRDTKLFVPLGPDGPQPLPDGIPRLWLLAPLEEDCRAGWLLNSYAFRVDPGRGRLAGTHEERAKLFARLGRALGERLAQLHDLIEADWPRFAPTAGLASPQPSGAALFRQRLVEFFAPDVPRDAADERLETHLHRAGGLRHLFASRQAVPTGLPAPFAPFLAAEQVSCQIAESLADPSRLAQLRGWRSLVLIEGAAVSAETARLLGRLGFAAPPTFGVARLVRDELRATGGQADPETAARLGELLDDDFVGALPRTEQQELSKAAATARFLMADGGWREARLVPRTARDADEEEHRILAFAPDEAVADATYEGAALAFYRLAARQSGFQQRADTFSRWAREMADAERKRALLAYVLDGRQGAALGQALAQERPHWLPATADALRESALLEGFEDGQRGRLMTTLYPNLACGIGSGRLFFNMPSDVKPDEELVDPAAELACIRDWWRRDHAEQRAEYDGRIWPDGFRPRQLRDREAVDDRVGWFAFFALGIFRTLGWNNEGAHKSFVEAAMRRGWWEEMATTRLPADPQPWLDRLEEFACSDAWRIDFPQWRRTMADLYALARWLPDYAEAFRQLPAVLARDGRLALSDAWRLSASPVWQRRGLEGAPLAQSLGLGANWMIREAIRHGFWTGEDAARMHPYAWAATAKVRRLFAERLGHSLGERGSMDMSPDVHRFVVDYLGPDADFLGDLDLPLQLWDGSGAFFNSDAEEDDE